MELISRTDAIKDVETWTAVDEHERHLQKNVIEWLKEFPPAKLSTNLAEVGTDVPDINVGELISRQAAIETFKDCAANGVGIDGIVDALKQLPPANCSEFPNNSDTISRRASIDALNLQAEQMRTWAERYAEQRKGILTAVNIVEDMPTIQPKRGKWIKTARWGRVYYCNQCRNYLDFDGVNAGRGSTNFCPNCGAKMEVTT